ncbi:unnamed protein product, partial [Brachionus calyciflorus]
MSLETSKNLNFNSPYLKLRSRNIPKKDIKLSSISTENCSKENLCPTTSSVLDDFSNLSISHASSSDFGTGSNIVDYSSSESDCDEKNESCDYFLEEDLVSSSESSQSEIYVDTIEKANAQVELIESLTSRNKPMLIYGTYMYILEKKREEKIYWRCSYNNYRLKRKCGARIHTDLNHKPIYESKRTHHHSPEPEKIDNL